MEVKPNMWTVVHVAQSRTELKKVQTALEEQGVLIKIRQIGKGKNGIEVFEILVPASELEDACMVLTSIAY